MFSHLQFINNNYSSGSFYRFHFPSLFCLSPVTHFLPRSLIVASRVYQPVTLTKYPFTLFYYLFSFTLDPIFFSVSAIAFYRATSLLRLTGSFRYNNIIYQLRFHHTIPVLIALFPSVYLKGSNLPPRRIKEDKKELQLCRVDYCRPLRQTLWLWI